MFALDTNTLIYFFKGMGLVGQRLLATPPSAIGVPSVVLYELEFGLRRSSQPEKRRKQLEEFIRTVTILPFEEKAAKAAAQIRFELERAGLPIGPVDTLIAGTAAAWGATLVTRNTREFSRIRALPTVDWYA